MTWRRQGRRPFILGHRGASKAYLENTLIAIREAIAMGADGVELDVHLCASGEVVVFHDHTIDRLAGVSGRVAKMSWSELRAQPIGEGQTIPLLAEVLSATEGARVNVEIKRPPFGTWRETARAVVQVVRKAKAEERVIVSSFDPLALASFQVERTQVPIGLLIKETQNWLLRSSVLARPLRADAVHPSARLVTADRVRDWHDRGLAVNVWTVDDADEMRRLSQLGVDAIITNVPNVALDALGPLS